MPLPENYTIEQQGNGDYAVSHAFLGELINDAPFYSTALHFAQEHAAEAAEAEAAEIAECDALADFVNARGGYVAPDDHAGQGRGRAIDAVLGFIEEHKASLRKAHAAATARAA